MFAMNFHRDTFQLSFKSLCRTFFCCSSNETCAYIYLDRLWHLLQLTIGNMMSLGQGLLLILGAAHKRGGSSHHDLLLQ